MFAVKLFKYCNTKLVRTKRLSLSILSFHAAQNTIYINMNIAVLIFVIKLIFHSFDLLYGHDLYSVVVTKSVNDKIFTVYIQK